MRDYTTWTQSRFYNPAFNSSIFDGPIRIYFAQVQEPLALKIYFGLQQIFEHEIQRAKEIHRQTGASLCVLVYPNAEAFQFSFETTREFIVNDRLGTDEIVAIRGPFEDQDLPIVLKSVADRLRSWNPEPHGVFHHELAAEA